MEWIYTKNENNTARYVLGTVGKNPLICFGINPSTAAPENLDNTVKSVQRIAHHNGYDSWIMLNLYPQRATNPNDMHRSCDVAALQDNIREISRIIQQYDQPDLWVAWGTLIKKRPYLQHCLKQLLTELAGQTCNWVTIGELTKQGHPHHPLYLRTDSTIKPFDILAYVEQL